MVNFLRSLWARHFGHYRIEEVQLVEGETEQEWRYADNFTGNSMIGPCTVYRVHYSRSRLLDEYWQFIGIASTELRARAVIYKHRESLKAPDKSKPVNTYY